MAVAKERARNNLNNPAMRQFLRLEYEQKTCVSYPSYSVRVPNVPKTADTIVN